MVARRLQALSLETLSFLSPPETQKQASLAISYSKDYVSIPHMSISRTQATQTGDLATARKDLTTILKDNQPAAPPKTAHSDKAENVRKRLESPEIPSTPTLLNSLYQQVRSSDLGRPDAPVPGHPAQRPVPHRRAYCGHALARASRQVGLVPPLLAHA